MVCLRPRMIRARVRPEPNVCPGTRRTVKRKVAHALLVPPAGSAPGRHGVVVVSEPRNGDAAGNLRRLDSSPTTRRLEVQRDHSRASVHAMADSLDEAG